MSVSGKKLAEGNLPTRTDLQNLGENPWYLVMEEDVDLCPKWRRRMAEELPLLPPDADVVKLYFFGHWRKEDAAPAVNKSGHKVPSPFLLAQNPLSEFDIIKAATYEVLHGAGWSNVPVAGFYAGTQAYLLRPSGARKLLENIQGKPFQDIDMTMMLSARNYVWRRVMANARPENVNLLQLESRSQVGSKLGSVPTCNAETSRRPILVAKVGVEASVAGKSAFMSSCPASSNIALELLESPEQSRTYIHNHTISYIHNHIYNYIHK